MAPDFSDRGAFNVDGQWATAIGFEVGTAARRPRRVRLRFWNGEHEVARTVVPLDGLAELLGPDNDTTVRRAIAKTPGDAPVHGVLTGQNLVFGRAILPARAGNSVTPEPPQAHPVASTVPPAIAARYVVRRHRFYFQDDALAFVDQGTKLLVRTENAAVAQHIAEIAKHRGWHAIRVQGTSAFVATVTEAAQRAGLGVNRQAPKPKATPRRIRGQLVEAGAAPYRFDATAGLSYFVRLRTPTGDRVVWGRDLERALVESESKVKLGDEVALESRSAHAVAVEVPRRNDRDELVGIERRRVQRHHWSVEHPAYFSERDRATAAFEGGVPPDAALARRHPPLASAQIAMRLGELFAQRIATRADDQRRVISGIRQRLVDALRSGQELRVPILRRDAAARLARRAQPSTGEQRATSLPEFPPPQRTVPAR